MKTPQISILTPVYNGENYIAKSIESVVNQTFVDWEMIIVNDGSIDNTLEVIREFDDPRIKVINLELNKGRPYARQKALEEVNTKYFCFLDADDFYYPDKLKNQFDFMEKNLEYDLLSNAIGMIDKEGSLIGVLKGREGEFSYDKYHLYDKVPHASCFIRRSSLGSITYDEKLKYTQDQDFLRRLLINKKYYFQNTINYIYTRESSFSFKKYRQSLILENQSLKKVDNNFFRNFKRKVLANFKIIVVFSLTILKLEHLYLSKIGCPPSKNEIKEYEKYFSL